MHSLKEFKYISIGYCQPLWFICPSLYCLKLDLNHAESHVRAQKKDAPHQNLIIKT